MAGSSSCAKTSSTISVKAKSSWIQAAFLVGWALGGAFFGRVGDLVGRSRAFWEHFYPLTKQSFTGAFDDVPLEDFYFAINDVRPSLIRVEADEATYNLHILLRFEIEQALVRGDLAVADLPQAWNDAIPCAF